MATNMIESIIVEKPPKVFKPVDRERTCPFLLRVFCSFGRHNSVKEYRRGRLPKEEFHIYTWRDATLDELTDLIRKRSPETRIKGTYFDFALVIPNEGSGYNLREIGVTRTGYKGADDVKSLQQEDFQIGDFMDIAVTLPKE